MTVYLATALGVIVGASLVLAGAVRFRLFGVVRLVDAIHVRAEPGDVVVLRLPNDSSPEVRERCAIALHEMLPDGIGVVAATMDTTVEVIEVTADEDEEPTPEALS